MPVIRPATLEDAKKVARIHAASWRSAYRGLLPQRYLDAMSPATLLGRWQRRLRWNASRSEQDSDTWVVERRGRVAGFVLMEPVMDDTELAGFAGEVTMLYIDPKHTGKGLGRALLDRAFELLAAREYYWAIIWVLEKNHRARRFYENAGMRVDGARREDRFVNERVSVIRYARALNPVIDFEALSRGTVSESG